MSGNFIDFVPSTITAFNFQPTWDNTIYNVTVTWNVFGQRYYVNVTDTSGNLILCRGMSETGPGFVSSFTWLNGIATVTTATPHNVPLGAVANIYVSGTGDTFDGSWQALATGAYTMTYAVDEPANVLPENGTLSFPLNLIEGYLPGGWLLYHADTGQIEY